MLSRSKRAAIYLILAIALWGGLAPRLMPCMPAEAAMSCCVHEAEQCAMDEDCCHCGSAPARDLTIPTIVKPSRPIELPVGLTFQFDRSFERRCSIAGAGSTRVPDNSKSAKLYLLNRSLLI